MEIVVSAKSGRVKYDVFKDRHDYHKFYVRDKFDQQFELRYDPESKQWENDPGYQPEAPREFIGEAISVAFGLQFDD